MYAKYFCRFASIVLLAAVLICSLSSCKTNGDESASPSSALSEDVSQTDAYRDENGSYVPDLPAKDWGEREFRVLVRSSKFGTYQSDDFTTDSQMYGDLINDQVYERNARIEERYNVKIVPVLSDALLADIRTEVVAGTGMFDAAMPTLREAGKAACMICARWTASIWTRHGGMRTQQKRFLSAMPCILQPETLPF